MILCQINIASKTEISEIQNGNTLGYDENRMKDAGCLFL